MNMYHQALSSESSECSDSDDSDYEIDDIQSISMFVDYDEVDNNGNEWERSFASYLLLSGLSNSHNVHFSVFESNNRRGLETFLDVSSSVMLDVTNYEEQFRSRTSTRLFGEGRQSKRDAFIDAASEYVLRTGTKTRMSIDLPSDQNILFAMDRTFVFTAGKEEYCHTEMIRLNADLLDDSSQERETHDAVSVSTQTSPVHLMSSLKPKSATNPRLQSLSVSFADPPAASSTPIPGRWDAEARSEFRNSSPVFSPVVPVNLDGFQHVRVSPLDRSFSSTLADDDSEEMILFSKEGMTMEDMMVESWIYS